MKAESAKTTIRKSGNSVVVRLPQEFHLPLGGATISRMGDSLVIHSTVSDRTTAFMENLRAMPDDLFDDLAEPEEMTSEPIDTW